MKKVIGILCVFALLMGVAGMAMASETNWSIIVRTSSTTSYSVDNSSVVQCGTDSTKGDGHDSAGESVYNTSSGNSGVAIYQANWGDAVPLYSADKRAPIVATDPLKNAKSWDLRIWINTGYGSGDSLRFAWYSTSTLTPPSTIGGVAYDYTFEVINDPTGTFVAGTKWSYTPGATGTSTAPVAYKDFNNINCLKLSGTGIIDSGIKLRLTAAPHPTENTPEPGSLLALGSGLVGLVGFAIRRRR